MTVDTYTPILWAVLSDDEKYAEYIRVRQEHEALLDALLKLANEAAGFLEMADVFTHGATNCAVLQERIDNARAALAKAEGQ